VSKFDEAMDASKAQMESCSIECDEALLKNVTKALGPSIYNKDATISHAIEKIGSSNRQKLRPVFYYLIVKYLKKESIYS